jgi:hypothetical protein
MTDGLLTRLRGVGALWTGEASPWGSYEILTPAGAAEKYLWCTPLALTQLLDEWEAEGFRPRLAVLLG